MLTLMLNDAVVIRAALNQLMRFYICTFLCREKSRTPCYILTAHYKTHAHAQPVIIPQHSTHTNNKTAPYNTTYVCCT